MGTKRKFCQKLYQFSKHFSKISPQPLILVTPEVPWFDQIVIFEADHDEIELQKYSYDVTSVTSSPLRHRNTSPK